MSQLRQQLEASNRLYRKGYTDGYHAGRVVGHSKGMVATLEEVVAKYDELDVIAFWEWIGDARAILSEQQGGEQ